MRSNRFRTAVYDIDSVAAGFAPREILPENGVIGNFDLELAENPTSQAQG
jgi:hypothetical protein